MSWLESVERFAREVATAIDGAPGPQQALTWNLAAGMRRLVAAESEEGLRAVWLLLERSFAGLHARGADAAAGMRDDLALLPDLLRACEGWRADAIDGLLATLAGMRWLEVSLDDVAAVLRSAGVTAGRPREEPPASPAPEPPAAQLPFDDFGRTMVGEPLPFAGPDLPPVEPVPPARDAQAALVFDALPPVESTGAAWDELPATAAVVPGETAGAPGLLLDDLSQLPAPAPSAQGLLADGDLLLDDAGLLQAVDGASDADVEDAGAEHAGVEHAGVEHAEVEYAGTEDPGAEHTEDAAEAGAGLSSGALQIVEMLRAELPELHAVIATFSGLSRSEGMDFQLVAEAGERCARMLARYGEAAASVGFAGLGQVFAHAAGSVEVLAPAPGAVSAEQAEMLVELGVHVRDYLDQPRAAARAAALVRWCSFGGWPQPLSPPEAQAIAHALRDPDFSLLEEGIVARPEIAEDEDVSLQIPADVNRDLLDGMLQELPGQSEAFSAAIERLSRGGDIDDLNVAQRIAHTIKGSGNTVGIRGLAALTHHLEDILLALAREGMLPPPALSAGLMNAADCLQAMTEALLSMGPAPDDARAVLQEVLDWANRIDRHGLPAADEAAPRRAEPARADAAAAGPAPAGEAAAERPAQPDAEPAATLRVAGALIDQLLAGTGENIILTGQLREGAQRAISDLRSMQDQFELLQQLGAELEELIDVKDFSRRQLRDQDARFDALEMDQYNELHSCARRLAEAATDARELGRGVAAHLSALDDLLVTQEGQNRATQDIVMRTRMIEVKTLFPRLQRSVRQTCRMLDKRVELHLNGGDTPMDSDVLNRIADPLMHLLRNAIDHGIEAQAPREAAGKPAAGNVWLDFARDGNNILVRCRDDGAGLNFDAIRRTAVERGLIAPDEEVGEEALKQLILAPNFSTRNQATQVSGRGIGLDAVHTGIAQLGGSLDIRSRAGQGCQFEFRLPFNLISSHALLVRAGSEIVAVASRGVAQIVHPADGSLQQLGPEPVFRLGENFYPVRAIGDALGIGGDRRTAERRARPVILAKTRKATVAVQVDAVLGSRDMVVKSLGQYVPRVRGVIGATILGDGKVSAVLDLPDLLSQEAHAAHDTTVGGRTGSEPRAGRSYVLVVDDSLSARRALAQFMQDCGYDVRSARDGMEAAQIAAGRTPDLVIADLEMPRMNGIELAAHLRATPLTARVPVIMITSRSTGKHQEQALAAGVDAYMTKPYSEDVLLAKVRELLHARTGTDHERTGTLG